MKELFNLKTWAGPLTIGSFVVMAVTGLMLFFHSGVGATKLAHEWIGWLLVVGGLAHLLVNWRTFFGYFRKLSAIAIILIVCLLGLVAILWPSGGRGPSGHGAMMAVFTALEESPLSVAADVAKCSPEAAVEKLKAADVKVTDSSQTIAQIAKANKMRGMEVLVRLFAKESEADGGKDKEESK